MLGNEMAYIRIKPMTEETDSMSRAMSTPLINSIKMQKEQLSKSQNKNAKDSKTKKIVPESLT